MDPGRENLAVFPESGARWPDSRGGQTPGVARLPGWPDFLGGQADLQDGALPGLAGPTTLVHRGVVDLPVLVVIDVLRQDVRRGGEVLINLTNDGWFDGTAEVPQHAAIARLRAVETRRALVRATNSGLTMVVDAAGRLVEEFASGRSEVRMVRVPLPRRPDGPGLPVAASLTFYTKYGDWFAISCLAGILVCLGLALRSRFKHDSTPDTPLPESR